MKPIRIKSNDRPANDRAKAVKHTSQKALIKAAVEKSKERAGR